MNKPESKLKESPVSDTNTLDNFPTKNHFEFITQEHLSNFNKGLFKVLPDTQDDSYEEKQFAKRMKKSRRL